MLYHTHNIYIYMYTHIYISCICTCNVYIYIERERDVDICPLLWAFERPVCIGGVGLSGVGGGGCVLVVCS